MLKRVAAIQMNSTAIVEENLNTVEKLIKVAADKKSLLAILPENVAILGKHEEDKLQCAETLGAGPIQDFISSLAKKYQIWIVGGTIPIKVENENRISASCMVWDDQGKMKAHYNKIHLFDVTVSTDAYNESKTIAPGKDIVTVDSPIGKLGLSICYDIRFPELYRKLSAVGAEVLCIPAAFTKVTGSAHWEILCRARAIENLCYVLAAAQFGTHANGRSTYGHSMIVDPWGTVVACLPSGEGVIVADLNLDFLKETREKFPVLHHIKLC